MAPRLPFPNLMHRVRRAHPLAPAMRRDLQRWERASPEEVRAFQDRRLRHLVAWAARRSPFYREFFATSGVRPEDVRGQDDLHLLPLLDRHHLTEDPERFCAYPRRLMWPSRSSGTSGTVVTVYRTPGSSVYEMAALQRQWGWFGVPRDARRLVSRAAGGGLGHDAAGSPVEVVAGARSLLVSGYVFGRGEDDRLLRAVRDFAPEAVEGWPSSLALLAALLDQRGETLPVSGVITSSEVMTSQQVSLLERAFAAPVIDHYGQTERVALAGSCPAGGYHLFSDYAVTELLPVPGQSDQWEVVGTPLHNWGFPLLRYRTGDTVGAASSETCSCGLPFPLVGAIGGRTEDTFTSLDGRPLPLPGTVVDDIEGVEEIQIAQLRAGHFEVRLVPRSADGIADVEAQVRGNVDRYFGPGQELDFAVLERIPRSPSGKLRPAVDESPADQG